jgi:hypothetical protein
MRQFTHGGSAGDLIYSLAAVKGIGGGEFYINREAPTDYRMSPDRIESMLTLLRAQPYLSKVGVQDGWVGTCLNQHHAWRQGLNLSDMVSSNLGIDHAPREEPWLFVPSVKRVAPVVIARSPRYHVGSFPWRRVLDTYQPDAVFVGDLWEHADFCQRFGPVSYHYTPNYLELAQVIAGADLFVGNQSSPAAVAQGLRVPMVQETVSREHWAWNCHHERQFMIHGYNENVYLPSKNVLPGLRRTLLTFERLEQLAKLSKETCGLPGLAADVGTYLGGSAAVIAACCKARTVHVFDSLGIPEDDVAGGSHKKGDFAASEADLRGFLEPLGVTLHIGLFPDTAVGLENERFNFVHLDLDLYTSTKAALEWFMTRMVPGGIMVLDDVGHDPTPGVDIALRDVGLWDRLERIVQQQGQIRF